MEKVYFLINGGPPQQIMEVHDDLGNILFRDVAVNAQVGRK